MNSLSSCLGRCGTLERNARPDGDRLLLRLFEIGLMLAFSIVSDSEPQAVRSTYFPRQNFLGWHPLFLTACDVII
ncbi:MAG: hypothetical protein ACK49R_18055 [Planctomycetota bacterium]|jgi:hypothetical protein|nr:hypothetical protein [Blastopirellula sp.]